MLATWSLLLLLTIPSIVRAQSRTSPPGSGAVVVRQNTTTTGEFGTISAAISSLPSDSSSQSIFIYPGTYIEQVNITRTGPLKIYGYTTDGSSFSNNVVTISHFASQASGAGGDDMTGTLRVHKDDFAMYNVDVRNTFGKGSQAVAISAFGNRMGLYASRFFSFQDTLYANTGTQIYAKSYIEGAVDFIFGGDGRAYFEGNTIASLSSGCVTASGRGSNDSSIYLMVDSTLILGPNAAANTNGNVFLGRPWGDYAQVVFKNTNLGAHINPALWSIWNPGDNRTDHVFFGTYNNTGAGADDNVLPDFATALTASQAAEYTIAMAVGEDWANWVDLSYVSGK